MSLSPTLTRPTSTSPITSSPFTTSPTSTSPITFAPLSGSPITTSPVTPPPVTISPVASEVDEAPPTPPPIASDGELEEVVPMATPTPPPTANLFSSAPPTSVSLTVSLRSTFNKRRVFDCSMFLRFVAKIRASSWVVLIKASVVPSNLSDPSLGGIQVSSSFPPGKSCHIVHAHSFSSFATPPSFSIFF